MGDGFWSLQRPGWFPLESLRSLVGWAPHLYRYLPLSSPFTKLVFLGHVVSITEVTTNGDPRDVGEPFQLPESGFLALALHQRLQLQCCSSNIGQCRTNGGFKNDKCDYAFMVQKKMWLSLGGERLMNDTNLTFISNFLVAFQVFVIAYLLFLLKTFLHVFPLKIHFFPLSFTRSMRLWTFSLAWPV